MIEDVRLFLTAQYLIVLTVVTVKLCNGTSYVLYRTAPGMLYCTGTWCQVMSQLLIGSILHG